MSAPHILRLPAKLDFSAVQPLSSQFAAYRNSPLSIDFSSVTFCGALALQLLVAAALQWRHDGQDFKLTGTSPEFKNALKSLGCDFNFFLERA